MKLIALSILLFTFAFSNCEPVKRPETQQAPKQQKSEPSREQQEKRSKGTEITARVVGVSDGDSMVVLVDGTKRERVRLATIDAPENHQAFGKPSKQSLSDMVYNKEIKIITVDTDKYGRIVGEIFIDDTNVNLVQLKRGFAWHYKAHQRQQTKEKREEYATAENKARSNKTGLWQEKNPTPPWEYRKKNPRN